MRSQTLTRWTALTLATLPFWACGDSPTAPAPLPGVPSLSSPVAGATLDNGCRDGSNPVTWDFDWSDVAGATEYHLYVIGSGSSSPAVDQQGITGSSYQHARSGGYVVLATETGWRWRVRARVNGTWGPWSPEQAFDVEPFDTDCSILLVSPPRNAVVDNGCFAHNDDQVWEFDWTDVPGAERYHAYVYHPGASVPVLDRDDLRESYRVLRTKSYVSDVYRTGWHWRVRALVDGTWTPWTDEQPFDVEPANSDCQ